MPITSSLIKVTNRYTYLGQKCENVQYYHPVGAAFLTADMTGVLEAYWNDIKASHRAIMTNFDGDATWDSILGEEIGGGLSYAEYPIPTLERVGTRATTGLGDPLNSFSAGGIRLTVGTRVTRPGQKRFPFLFEADVQRNALGAAYLALLTAVGVKYSESVFLGVPVATGELQPMIVRINRTTGEVEASQPVTGKVVNPNITTQVSRKVGRGI